jgi:hypothetical protein
VQPTHEVPEAQRSGSAVHTCPAVSYPVFMGHSHRRAHGKNGGGQCQGVSVYIPQVVETNTPRALDVTEEPLLYDGFMAGILAFANGIGMLKSRVLIAFRLGRT